MFRAYRLGQENPCFIYRFIGLGSLEEQVYKRQVTKLSISKRVIDEQQIDRHYKQHELSEYYSTERICPQEERPEITIPEEDPVLSAQLRKLNNVIYSYHKHDSLLEHKVDEGLTENEIESAWEHYQDEMGKTGHRDKLLKYKKMFDNGKNYCFNIMSIKLILPSFSRSYKRCFIHENLRLHTHPAGEFIDFESEER